MKNEIERSKAITGVAQQVIANGKLVLDAEIAKSEYSLGINPKKLLVSE